MSGPYSTNSRSPPPLRHPVPTHPAMIPEPPSTPVSPQGYMRFTSSPTPPNAGAQPGYYQQQGQHGTPQQTNYSAGFLQQQQQQQTFSPGRAQAHPAQGPQSIDFAQWGVNPATAQFGMQLGQSAVAAGQEYVSKNVGILNMSFTSVILFTK